MGPKRMFPVACGVTLYWNMVPENPVTFLCPLMMEILWKLCCCEPSDSIWQFFICDRSGSIPSLKSETLTVSVTDSPINMLERSCWISTWMLFAKRENGVAKVNSSMSKSFAEVCGKTLCLNLSASVFIKGSLCIFVLSIFLKGSRFVSINSLSRNFLLLCSAGKWACLDGQASCAPFYATLPIFLEGGEGNIVYSLCLFFFVLFLPF